MAFCTSYAHRGALDQSSLEPWTLIHSDLSAEGAQYWKKNVQERYLNSPYQGDNDFGQSIKDGKRLVVYNVWRPVKIVEDNPLAICYWDSLRPGDKTDHKLKPTSHSTAIQTWKYEEHQKWAFLSNQKPEEAFVFMQHDSHGKGGHGINVPHASVILEGQEDKPSTRQSYEFKIAVIMDDQPGFLHKLFSCFSFAFKEPLNQKQGKTNQALKIKVWPSSHEINLVGLPKPE